MCLSEKEAKKRFIKAFAEKFEDEADHGNYATYWGGYWKAVEGQTPSGREHPNWKVGYDDAMGDMELADL
jgi:hypothetical protein